MLPTRLLPFASQLQSTALKATDYPPGNKKNDLMKRSAIQRHKETSQTTPLGPMENSFTAFSPSQFRFLPS